MERANRYIHISVHYEGDDIHSAHVFLHRDWGPTKVAAAFEHEVEGFVEVLAGGFEVAGFVILLAGGEFFFDAADESFGLRQNPEAFRISRFVQ